VSADEVGERDCVDTRWRLTSQCDIVEVSGKLDGLDLAAYIVVFDLAVQIRYCWMCRVVCAKHLDCFLHPIGLVDIVN
jgi:hypothetical protein